MFCICEIHQNPSVYRVRREGVGREGEERVGRELRKYRIKGVA